MSHQYFDLNAVRSLVSNKRTEDLHLDFKTISKPDFSIKDDRRNLAIAVTGFANSDGGIIIWGIEATKGADGIDCASAERPIGDVALAFSRLNELTGELASPRILGLTHRRIDSEEGKGFIVTEVDTSDSGPHMAKLGENRYYKRSGAGFYQMEHFDIADMFGRRRRPQLKVVHHLEENSDRRVRIVLGLKNNGRAPALYPLLRVRMPTYFERDRYGIDGNGSEGLPRITEGDPIWLSYGANVGPVVHPNTVLWVFAIESLSPSQIPARFDLEYQCCADSFPLTESTSDVQVRAL